MKIYSKIVFKKHLKLENITGKYVSLKILVIEKGLDETNIRLLQGVIESRKLNERRLSKG